MKMRLVPGSIECLLLSLVVSDSCTLIIVHHSLWIESNESRHLLAISKSCLQMLAGMAETDFSHACCCSYLDAERVSLWYNILQLNYNVYVHLMNIECA